MTTPETDMTDTVPVEQGDIDRAEKWRGILEYHVDFEGDAIADLARDYAEHRLAFAAQPPADTPSGDAIDWKQRAQKAERELLFARQDLEIEQHYAEPLAEHVAATMDDAALARPADTPSGDAETALIALTHAIYDAENTSRLAERPEEVAEYRHRAEAVARWLEAHGYVIRPAAGLDAETRKAIIEETIDQLGWPEIHAFQDELRKGQDIREDAGGFMLRAIKALLGIRRDDQVTTYQQAARALVAEARALKEHSDDQ